MRVLVTGAAGFVGGHMIHNLLESGHKVIACARHPIPAQGGIKVEVFDIRQAEHVKSALISNSPDAVIHLAAIASVPDSWADPNLTYRVNLLGAGNLLEALRDFPQTRVLLVGSAQQYGRESTGHPLVETDPLGPTSPYAVSKVAQELLGRLYFEEFSRPVLMTRTFNHFGPGQSPDYVMGSFCSQLVAIQKGEREPRMEVGRLDSVRDFLDVRDVVNAYRVLIEKGEPGEVYNVCSGEGRRVGDILKLLIDEAELTSSVEVVEDPNPRAGDLDQLIGDNSKIRSQVPWEPLIPLETSLADTLASYVDRTE
jgi:GDP-4-dehydro-6-deoxy-D-mannose reductase